MDAPVPETSDEEARYGHLRAAPRDSMFLVATMRRANGAETTIRVRNLSSGGMMAEVDTGFSPGEPIEAELRGIGPVRGRVAWAAGGRIGVQFEVEIDPRLARKPVGKRPPMQFVKPAAGGGRPGLR